MRDGQTKPASLLNLPNIVTFARLCAVPVAFWLVVDRCIQAAFLLFVAAGLSDALDGWLARRYGGNAVGAVADKALLVTMYVTLAVMGHAVTIRPLYISKLNTVLQIVLVAVILLQQGFGLGLPLTSDVMIWTVAVTTLASGAAYVRKAAQGEAGGASGPG